MGTIKGIRQVNINDLVPYENNAKIHNEEQIRRIADSITEFGFLSPLLIDKDKNVIAGHGRLLASKRLGLEKVPCISVDGLTEEQRKAYILADNRLSELGTWDKELVAAEIESLSNLDFDVDLTGFELPELPDADLDGYYGDERERTNRAYNLDIAHAVEKTNDFWQMPIIENNHAIPTRLIGFNYAKTSKEKDTGIHFFLDDYQFERVWNDPEKYIDILSQYQVVLSPDFSLYMDMPMPMKVWNVYRSRAIGAHWQSKGIKVIPTLSWAEKETFDFCFLGIPTGSIVAVSTIGVKNNENALQIWKDGMTEAIKQIQPVTVIVYGGKLDFDFGDIEVIYFENEVTDRWE